MIIKTSRFDSYLDSLKDYLTCPEHTIPDGIKRIQRAVNYYTVCYLLGHSRTIKKKNNNNNSNINNIDINLANDYFLN